MVIMPEWTPLMIGLHAYIGFLIVGLVPLANAGLVPLNYSRFRTSDRIGMRPGAFIAYFIPILVLLAAAYGFGVLPQATTVQFILLGAMVAHFTKRCLEVLLVHVFSGGVDILTAITVTSFYSLVTFIVALSIQSTPAMDGIFWIGAILFVVGLAGNLYHHNLLARLRRGGSKEYRIPQGGLFGLVCSPHYLFELLGWLGFALMGRHLIFYMITLIMTVYLFNRAHKVQLWYKEKFPDYPASIRRIIPGIY